MRRTPPASAAAAALLGVDAPGDRAGLASFGGVGRRLEVKGEPGGVLVIDDYGHHPTAIRATLAAVRERYPGRPVWAVHEPLTYHRTAAMLDELAEALATRRPGRHRRHLGRARSRHDDHQRRGARRGGRAGQRRRGRGTRQRRGDGRLPGRARPARRRRAGHGRRPLVRHRRAPRGGCSAEARTAGRMRAMPEPLTPGDGQDVLARFKRRREARDPDAHAWRSSPRTPSSAPTRSSRALTGRPRHPRVTGTTSLPSRPPSSSMPSASGSPAAPCSASWHEAYTAAPTAERVRVRGVQRPSSSMTPASSRACAAGPSARVVGTSTCDPDADRERRGRWLAPSRSTSSASSTARSSSTPSTRSAARSPRATTSRAPRSSIELAKKEIVVVTDSEMRSEAHRRPRRQQGHPARTVAQGLRLGHGRASRGHHLPADASTLRQGLPEDLAKKITKLIRDEFPKVQGADPGRCRARERQVARTSCRPSSPGCARTARTIPSPLQFKNYR